MMSKEQMIDDVIRQRGFEDSWTIWFCELSEVLNEEQLYRAYVLLLSIEEDEEEN